MAIFYKTTIKNQILNNIGEAKKLSICIKECFYPINNLLWCNELNLYDPLEEEQFIVNFKSSAHYSLANIKELLDLFYINQKLCKDYTKLEEFSYNFFKQEFHSLEKEANNTITGLKSLKTHQTTKDIRQAIKILEIIKTSISSSHEEILMDDTHKISI